MADNPLGIRSFATDDEDTAAMFADEEPGDEVSGERTDEPGRVPSAEEIEGEDQPVAPPPEREEEPLVEGELDDEEVEQLAEEYAGQYADTFRTVDELERGYGEVRSAFTRVAQEASTQQQQVEALQSALQEQQGQTQQILEFMQAQLAETDPEFADELQRRMAMQEEMQSQIAPIQEQLQQERDRNAQVLQVQQMQQQAAATVRSFYEDHPEIEPGSPADNSLTRTYASMDQALHELTGGQVRLDPTNREHLDLIHEIAQNPQLGAELMMAPNALRVPDGVARLRERAGATIAATGAPPRENGQGAPRGPQRRRLEGFVETGTGGAPTAGAPGESPKDEFDEAWEWYKGKHNARGPLFGSQRT